jgi:Transposase DDE domain
MNATPFFPALRSQLAAQGQRTCQNLRRLDFPPLLQQLRLLLPPQLLAGADEGPNSRERIFSLRLTFECFLWQMLKPRTACREVVRAVQALFESSGRGSVDEGTAAYVQARQRLPVERLEKALAHTARTADRRVGRQGQLQGRPVKVVDCSTTQLPDTARNQKRYPQPSSQKPGCGFPLLKFLVLFSLSSGAILRVATAHWKNHDLRLLHGLWDALEKGDILLGDRAYGEYLTLAMLPGKGVDVVARMHGARKVDYRKAMKRLGRHDGLFQWSKGYSQSEILSAREWRQVPGQITVRLLRFDAVIRRRKKRITLVTTLLDPAAYPADQLIGLYARRWHLELALRHLKTTMGMELLRCQSPDMAEKELFAYLVAYNLIRCLMAQAVAQAGVEMERLSFKGALDAVRQFTPAIHQARSKVKRQQICEELLRTIVRDLVPVRPGRTEPRAVKRRPKAYQLLNKPRHQFREMSHRCRYRKPAGKESK